MRIFVYCSWWLTLLSPALPKIGLAEGIYVYPHEFALAALCFLSVFRPSLWFKHGLQKLLLAFWLTLLFTTLLSFTQVVNVSDALRVIKGLLYIPLVGMSLRLTRKSDSTQHVLSFMLRVAVFAMLFNFIYYVTAVIPRYGFDIWQVQSLSSGFSNKFFDLVSFEFGVIPSGAHGVWGSYCVLIIMLALFCSKTKQVNPFWIYTALSFAMLSIALTVSRESLLVLFICAIFVPILLGLKRFLIMITGAVSILAISILLFAPLLFQLPLVQKITYTTTSFKQTGREGNIALRLSVWQLSLEAISHNPWRLFYGYGFNTSNYAKALKEGADRLKIKTYPSVPESLFVLALVYGGSCAFFMIVLFLLRFMKLAAFEAGMLGRFMLPFLIALTITNTVSGASLISDMLYGQILIIASLLYREKARLNSVSRGLFNTLTSAPKFSAKKQTRASC